MKVKVITGANFTGCLGYVLRKPRTSEQLGGTSPNATSFLSRAQQLRAMRPDCKTPVLHLSLSQPSGERLTDDQWQAATSQLLSELGLAEHDYIFARHSDTSNDHIHIVVSKISPNGKIWNERNSAKRAMTATSKIEQTLGLTHTRTLAEFQQDEGHRRRIARDGVTNEFRRTGKVKSKIELAIQKRKSDEQNRRSHSISNGRRAEPELTPEKHRKEDRRLAAADRQTRPAPGRITSRPTSSGEVIFRQNNQVIASLNPDRTAVLVHQLDPDAIDFAIMHAQKSGQIPLEIFGTDEFIKLARKRAAELKIPCAQHGQNPSSPNWGSGNNQGLTQTKDVQQKGESQVKTPEIQTPATRLNEKFCKLEESFMAGRVKHSELDWRNVLLLKEWLTVEKKRDATQTHETLVQLALRDRHVTDQMIAEIEQDRAEAEQEQNERSAEKMRM